MTVVDQPDPMDDIDNVPLPGGLEVVYMRTTVNPVDGVRFHRPECDRLEGETVGTTVSEARAKLAMTACPDCFADAEGA